MKEQNIYKVINRYGKEVACFSTHSEAWWYCVKNTGWYEEYARSGIVRHPDLRIVKSDE